MEIHLNITKKGITTSIGVKEKRFKSNYQIPVVRYGVIQLKTKTGLNEEYQFSNYEFTEEFGNAFRDYQAEFLAFRS